jgi:cation diffusion facilitator family transporter
MSSAPADRESGPSTDDSGQDEGTLTVLLALGANVAVGILKLVAGLISGSSALLSEAAHSVGDSTTEILLLVALRRSDRPADRRHPFGYGKERYFWSLLAAGAIFVSGAAFSIYEGLHTIFGSTEESTDKLWINYPVLALVAIFEGTSFLQAIRRARNQARKSRKSLRGLLRDPEDPTVNSVAMEDSAALVGIVIAGIGVVLHQLTGDAVYDGIASLLIGVLLLVVAFLLARATGDLLIGKQANLQLLRDVEGFLENEAEIVDVVDVLSMLVGTGSVLLCVRADFADQVSSGDIENACMRIDADLRARFPELSEVFIQPVSRGDPRIEDRVQARYGRTLSDH